MAEIAAIRNQSSVNSFVIFYTCNICSDLYSCQLYCIIYIYIYSCCNPLYGCISVFMHISVELSLYQFPYFEISFFINISSSPDVTKMFEKRFSEHNVALTLSTEGNVESAKESTTKQAEVFN